MASKTEISTKEHVGNIRVQQWNVEHGICPRCGGKWFYEMKNMESFGDAQIIQGVSLLKRIKNYLLLRGKVYEYDNKSNK